MTDKEIAAQLRNPSGKIAGKVGNEMFRKNGAMIFSTIEEMEVRDGLHILEIGLGNGGHVPYLFQINQQIQYTGIDISEVMIQNAKSNCTTLIEAGKVHLIHTDGNTIPEDSPVYDIVFSVNTIYFWDDLVSYLKEIHRVLKPGGKLLLTFGTEFFMKSLSFTRYGFKIYSEKYLMQMLSLSGFNPVDSQKKNDRTESATGEMLDREYIILRAVNL